PPHTPAFDPTLPVPATLCQPFVSGQAMFQINLGSTGRYGDRLPRRAFLKIGALGGLTLADVLRLEAGQPAAQANRKSVILIFLEGGASHLDTYDLKPAAPAEIRGE